MRRQVRQLPPRRIDVGRQQIEDGLIGGNVDVAFGSDRADLRAGRDHNPSLTHKIAQWGKRRILRAVGGERCQRLLDLMKQRFRRRFGHNCAP
jgi:hypothetical protein